MAGAQFRLGSKAHDDALRANEPERYGRLISERLRSEGDVADWFAGGGAALRLTFSIAWPARFPGEDHRFVSIDWDMHEISQTDTSPIPIRPGLRAIQMPTGRAYPGRTAGALEIEAGVTAAIEYRFRIAGGYFVMSSFNAIRHGP